MKALISPIEIQSNGDARVCSVEEKTFPVANPLFWVNCSKKVSSNTHTYSMRDKTFNEIIVPDYIPVGIQTKDQPLTSGTIDL